MHATLLTLLLVVGAESPGTIAEQPAVTVTAWFGSMFQTCDAPGFGCYPGNNRYMRRYPALHDYYYRPPYNYRHLFDYPEHAASHAPRGFPTFPCRQSVGDVIFTPQNEPGAAVGPLQPIPSPPTMPEPTH